jgi:hypothetical protein
MGNKWSRKMFVNPTHHYIPAIPEDVVMESGRKKEKERERGRRKINGK